MTPGEARDLIRPYDPIMASDANDTQALAIAGAMQRSSADAGLRAVLWTMIAGGAAYAGVKYGLPAARRSGLLDGRRTNR
jgi:transcriptional regulator GlxA family with amidase domain